MKRPGNEKEYRLIANSIRQDVIRMIAKSGTRHAPSNLSAADLFTALYFGVLNHEPRKPDLQTRDRVFVSSGHLAPLYYATLSHSGYFSKKELLTFAQHKTELSGTISRTVKGVECGTGAGGNGLGIACGAALALHLDTAPSRVYCIASDSEHDNGAFWEAVLFAAKEHLANLTLIIDRNGIQNSGHTENVLPLESLRAKYEAFNWHMLEVDGHNICHVMDALNEAKAISGRPTVIIAHTIPGKGVSSLENRHEWNDATLSHADETRALAELRHE